MAAWNSGIFDCFNDFPICLYGTFCSPCLYGKVAEKVDGSSCLVHCCLYCVLNSASLCCLLHGGKRQSLRTRYGLQEDVNDYLITCVCPFCTTCQEARELQHHGDWSENLLPVTSQPRS